MTTPKIIYIAGTGRSGSTLLDIILGNAEGVKSCGELNRFPIREGKLSSGETKEGTIAFWQEFRSRFEKKSRLNWKNIAALCYRFEYHTGFAQFLAGAYSKKDLHEYLDYLHLFFDILFDLSEEQTVVDSSKYPGRGYFLSRIEGIDVSYIELMRAPEMVVQSFEKKNIEQPSKHWMAASTYYFTVGALCAALRNRLDDRFTYHRMTYEQMVTQPDELFQSLFSALKIDGEKMHSRMQNGKIFSVGDLFDGNRLRFADQVLFKSRAAEIPSSLRFRIAGIMNKPWYKA